MKTTTEAMSEIFTQLTGQNKGVIPLVESCNLILEYVLENGFGGSSSNLLTSAQIEKIKEDVINKIKTQVPIGVMLKDCELLDNKLKYTLSDNSSKELDLVTLINTKVNQSELINYVKKTDITNLITETKADNKYQLKGNYASQSDLENKQDKSTALKVSDVQAEVNKIIGNAPESLNTLQEIAEALGNDPNKINTILTQLGLKAEKSDLDNLKEKVITDIRFVNNIITYNENSIDKNIDLNPYVNLSTANIESIVENKGNTLYESKYGVKTQIDRLTQNVNKSFSGFAGGIYNFSYIQDDIEKLEGQYYLDRNTGSLVKCIKTTTSIINSAEYYKDYSLDSIIKNLENLTETGSNEKGRWFKDKRTGLIIQWGAINVIVTTSDYEEHIVDLPIPFLTNSYTTSITRNYNYHNISDGKWSSQATSNNKIKILTSGFTYNLGKYDTYFWTAIGV